MNALADAEWSAWHEVCDQLRATGAVTAEDLQARATDDSTPGRRLLIAIREWERRSRALAFNYST